MKRALVIAVVLALLAAGTAQAVSVSDSRVAYRPTVLAAESAKEAIEHVGHFDVREEFALGFEPPKCERIWREAFRCSLTEHGVNFTIDFDEGVGFTARLHFRVSLPKARAEWGCLVVNELKVESWLYCSN